MFLLEVTAGFNCRGWVNHSVNTSKITFSDHFTTVPNAPTALMVDGGTYTEYFTIPDVEAAGGRWAYIDGVLYVRPAGGALFFKSVTAVIPFFFSNKPRVTTANKYYDPRLDAVPSLSLRIEPRFSGVGQIGSGTCKLHNGDSFFDEYHSKLDWDFGTFTFYMGADSNAGEMAFADFDKVGTWKCERPELNDKTITFHLKEGKVALDKEVPFETYTQTDYPTLDRSDVGKVIPRAYGKIFGAKPVLIAPGSRQFKLAGHAIYDILEVRVRNSDDIWETVNPTSRTLSDATFILDSADWENGQEVSVDFIGRVLADGKPMYNPADIVEDLLEYIGESNFSGFAAAFAEFDIGEYSTGIRNTVLKPSLYINEARKAIEIISDINKVAGTFLYINADGQWHYGVSKPVPLGSVTHRFTEQDILQDTFSDDRDASKLFSKVVCNYARREQDNYHQSVERTRRYNRFGHGQLSEITNTLTAPLWEERDATYYAERLLTTEGLPLVRYRFEVPWQAFFVVPGNNLHLVYAPKTIDTVVETLEVQLDLSSPPKVRLVCGDRRAWADSMGFWVADSQAAWSAGDSDAVKLENKQKSGFWTGEEGLAVSADGKSFETSRWH